MLGKKISSSLFLADVAVPVPIVGTNVLTYRATEAFSSRLNPGVRVIVPVGKRKITGIFVRWSDSENSTAPEKIKEILDIIDEAPVFPQDLMDLWQWAARYYLISPGEMLSAMLPGWMLTESEIFVHLKKAARTKKTKKSVQKKEEEERERVVTNGAFAASSDMSMFTSTEQAIWRYVQEKRRVSMKMLRRQFPPASLSRTLQKLEDAKLIELRDVTLNQQSKKNSPALDRPDVARAIPVSFVQLSPAQTAACKEITTALHAETFHVFLLHGVTGSGKTEVYLHMTHAALMRRKRVLLLVPEIALTHQLVEHACARFGQRVALLHSGQTTKERWQTWRRIACGEVDVVIGVRSAVFAPIENLGLIVVDEEHDSAYKQEDGPRYNARDLAIVRGKLSSCPVILGSATPSLESYVHCQTQRYSLLELPERIEARPLPSVEIVDLRQWKRDDNEADRIFSPVLRQALLDNYQAGKQSLLFLNRRGYASYLQCKSCGEVLACGQCSVTLTFHLQGRVLRCHYCGFSRQAPDFCPQCRELELEGSGVGTEQVEEALLRLLPDARVARLDRDSVRKKGVLGKVIGSWRAHETDVLIGTQMVTKGHDVPGVTLVGVLLADVALNLPDFRAAERTFQLLTQVAGRAGRGEDPGRVIIQTYSPQHYSVRCATRHDFQRFATMELRYRKKLGYPPFSRMVNVRFEGTDGERVRTTAQHFVDCLTARIAKNSKGPTILGPAPAPIERIKGRERWQVLIKGEDRSFLHDLVGKTQEELSERGRSSQLRIVVDVDPYNML
jgi:primosomal protein N' (replication factor Y)